MVWCFFVKGLDTGLDIGGGGFGRGYAWGYAWGYALGSTCCVLQNKLIFYIFVENVCKFCCNPNIFVLVC
jgi:hypothetical protein